ncbi:MAG: SDR family NAD(P)-dependent oxidoreductase, partial [Flavobacteriaceae bacterium]
MNQFKILKNKKILVTGGAGFIGSNLCEKLLELGCSVICLDNYSTGKFENIEEFTTNPDFTHIEGDIRDFNLCLKVTQNVDYVLHEAALGSVPRSIKDPLTSNEVNVSGFLNVLKAATENKIERFIY